MKKPVILLDCDGVLCDFTSVALELIEQQTGKTYTAEDIPRWDIFESLGHPELWELFTERSEEKGFCAAMKPYKESLKGIEKLRKKYEVLIVTAPVDALPWMYERAHWIEEHYGIPRKKVIFCHEKQHVKGDVFVDDKPDNVIAWAKDNPDGLAVLWEHPYNRSVVLPDRVIRTSDWNELASILKETFDDRKFDLGN